MRKGGWSVFRQKGLAKGGEGYLLVNKPNDTGGKKRFQSLIPVSEQLSGRSSLPCCWGNEWSQPERHQGRSISSEQAKHHFRIKTRANFLKVCKQSTVVFNFGISQHRHPSLQKSVFLRWWGCSTNKVHSRIRAISWFSWITWPLFPRNPVCLCWIFNEASNTRRYLESDRISCHSYRLPGGLNRQRKEN